MRPTRFTRFSRFAAAIFFPAVILLSAGLLSASENEFEDSQTFLQSPSPSRHPIFRKLDGVFVRAERIARDRWGAALLYRISSGQSASSLIRHYRELFKKSADLVNFTDPDTKNTNFGNGSSGYSSARILFDIDRARELAEKYPNAMELIRARGESLSWNTWLAAFGSKRRSRGDAELALLAIAARLGYARHALQPDSEVRSVLDQMIFENDPVEVATLLEGYTMGSFPARLFGFDLSGPKKLGEQSNWGRAYKTIAGVMFALALRREGFDDADVRLGVRLSTLAYEASDLLYDHVGKKSEDGIFQVRDRPRFNLAAPYARYLDRVRDQLAENPSLAIDLQNSLTEIPLLARVDKNARILDVSDDLSLTMLLIAHHEGNSERFLQQWGELSTSLDHGGEILSLIEAGSRDVASMVSGAENALEKMQSESRKPRTTKGIFRNLSAVEKLLGFFGI